MPRSILVAPTGHGVGLTTACLGLIRACERLGLRVGFHRPIGQATAAPGEGEDPTTAIVRNATAVRVTEPIPADQAEGMLSEDGLDSLMERVVERHQQAASGADVVIVEALWAAEQQLYATAVNGALARTLDADVVLVCAPRGREGAQVVEEVEIAAAGYGEGVIAGVVLNLVEGVAPQEAHPSAPAALAGAEAPALPRALQPIQKALSERGLRLVGAVPLNRQLLSPDRKSVV